MPYVPVVDISGGQIPQIGHPLIPMEAALFSTWAAAGMTSTDR